MANKQSERTASSVKKPAISPVNEVTPVNNDLSGQQYDTILMEQAIESPNHAHAGTILKLHQNYGNNEIKRVFNPHTEQKPIVNRRGELERYVADEIQRARSGGSPIPNDLNRQMSHQMGSDFSQVRLHTDQKADHLASRLQANAFTIGKNIFFRQGSYAPHTTRGKFTLTHELTHVIQQSGASSSGPLKLGPTHDSYEQEANHVASNQIHSKASAHAVKSAVIQRTGGGTTGVSSGTTAPRRTLPPLPTTPHPVRGGGTSNPPVTGRTLPPLPTTPHPVRGGSTTTQQTGITGPTVSSPSRSVSVVTNPIPPEVQSLGMIQRTWDGLTTQKRTIVTYIVSQSKPIGQSLVNLVHRTTKNWPLDGTDTEIMTNTVIMNIPTRFKIPLTNWNTVTKESRKSLLDLSAKPYIDQLGEMAKILAWPKDSTDAPTYDAAYLERIHSFYQVPFNKWNSLLPDLKGFLESITDGNAANAKELSAAALSANWPLNNAGGHISYAIWAELKKADPGLVPKKWNKLETTARAEILAATTDVERKKLLSKVNYKKDKREGKAEKAQKIFDNPIVDALSGGAGTSSSIAQLAEGENSKVSSGIGVGAAGLDTAVQGMSMIGSISKLVRGQRMASRQNASRAARTLGRQNRREGIWGVASSALGLGGSISSMVGASSKLHDKEHDKETGLSDRTDKAGGAFALASGALGATRSGIGLAKGFQRSSGAKKYIKPSATGDEKDLSDIASFTAKNQNRVGKGMDIAKNAFTSASGISSFFGDKGGVSAAVFGGLGLVTGIVNAIAGKVMAPSETEVGKKVEKLITLWGNNYAPAITFAKEVLKINEPDLTAWVNEDPEAAKDLIKSKLSKY